MKNVPTAHRHASLRRSSRGLSLIELMVAMVIGLVLIGGATQVYINSRATYNVNEGAARLQERARYALSVLEPDIRMAGYWGLAKDHLMISGRESQPTAALPAPPVVTNICGYNYIVDLSRPIQGNNNAFLLGSAPVQNCTTLAPRVSSDTLTVRYASAQINALDLGRYRLCSNRGGAAHTLSAAAVACGAPSQYNNLAVNGYYISNQADPASGGAANPSLRRMTLQGGNAVSMIDQEVIEGIEDMQVQFGIDPGVPPVVAAPGAPMPHCGLARYYVNPGAIPAAAGDPQIVSVRIWLLVRSDATETGFIDNRTYQYADRMVANGITNDLSAAGTAGRAYRPGNNAQLRSFRRMLVTRTFQVRNAEAIDSLALNDPRNPCP